MFKKILVALDGSKPAEAILPHATKLAQALSIPMVLMTAIDPEIYNTAKSPGPVHPQLKARQYLEQIVQRLARDGLKASFESAVGSPAEQILRVAERQGCNLVALLTHREKPAASGTLGSVTTKVLYHSHVPTLLAPPPIGAEASKQKVSSARVLVPLDGSSWGETALPYAEELARSLSLEILLVRAIQATPVVYMAEPSSAIPMATLQEATESEGTEYLKRVTEKLRQEGLTVNSQLVKGSAAARIVELAGSMPQSLIVMTTHGHSALARWLIGSVTETVARTAKNPVLVVPRQYGRRHATEVTELLGRAPLFAALTEGELENIAQMARIRSFPPGEVIVREGDRSGGLYVLTSGKVEVVKGASVVATLGPGEFFGEMSVIGDQPRSATVRAVEPTECLTIRRADFLAELERHPQIAVRMLPELVRRFYREGQDKPAN
jgi:nucleotide-binding universal stress UspA family protein